MKTTLTIFAIVNLFFVGVIGGLFVLSEIYPFQPGDALYGLQGAAEGWRLNLTPGDEKQAALSLELAERRLAELAGAKGEEEIEIAAVALDAAVDEAVARIDGAPAESQGELVKDLTGLFTRIHVVMGAFEGEGHVAVEALHEKVTALEAAETREEVAVIVNQEITAVAIPFLGRDVEHENFALTGGHGEVDCASCHTGGEYASTPTECGACHQLEASPVYPGVMPAMFYPDMVYADPQYPEHFEGDCADCHGIESWEPIAFDHQGVYECESCHEAELPAEHYPGECTSCHEDVEEWGEAAFDHTDVKECVSCHQQEAPAMEYAGICANCHDPRLPLGAKMVDNQLIADRNCPWFEWPAVHYEGECLDCHGTEEWNEIDFEHEKTGLTDCTSCHSDRLPAPHYPGECTDCHSTDEWAVDFEHTEETGDCVSCHQPEAPVRHYEGECSNCHNTEEWAEASFNHAGFWNCESCHSVEAPEGHHPGQCSDCHTSEAWMPANYAHLAVTDCTECHEPPARHFQGQCLDCHNIESWDATFNHSFPNCKSCHGAPAQHYDGQCGDCHNPGWWGNVDYAHNNLNDCGDCHDSKAPENHYDLDCSTCHTAADWSQIAVKHDQVTGCSECHEADAPEDHYDGQCSICHNTRRWKDVEVDHSQLADRACKRVPRDAGRPLAGGMQRLPHDAGLGRVHLCAHGDGELRHLPRGAARTLAGAVHGLPQHHRLGGRDL